MPIMSAQFFVSYVLASITYMYGGGLSCLVLAACGCLEQACMHAATVPQPQSHCSRYDRQLDSAAQMQVGANMRAADMPCASVETSPFGLLKKSLPIHTHAEGSYHPYDVGGYLHACIYEQQCRMLESRTARWSRPS